MIRFPKMHIAESVANRLLNFAEGVESGAFSIPSIPEPNPTGVELETRLRTPPSGAAPDEGVIEGAVTGEDPLESLVKE